MARQSRAPTILLTRPLPQSQRFAAAVQARWPELTVLISPLMAPEYLQPDLPRMEFTALILTSETGAEAARRISAAGIRLPNRAFCVGDRTAAAAQTAGFQAQSAGGDADALVAAILADPPPGALLHLRGEDSLGQVADRLLSAGLETVSAVAYRQTQQPLNTAALLLLQGPAPVILPLFSPRSVQIFAVQGPHVAPLWLAALSPAVAQSALSLAPVRVHIAARPDAPAMLDAIAALRMDWIGS